MKVNFLYIRKHFSECFTKRGGCSFLIFFASSELYILNLQMVSNIFTEGLKKSSTQKSFISGNCFHTWKLDLLKNEDQYQKLNISWGTTFNTHFAGPGIRASGTDEGKP